MSARDSLGQTPHGTEDAAGANEGYGMAAGVAADRGWVLERIFGRRKVAIGVVHCPPFPGAPRHRQATMPEIVEAALMPMPAAMPRAGSTA